MPEKTSKSEVSGIPDSALTENLVWQSEPDAHNMKCIIAMAVCNGEKTYSTTTRRISIRNASLMEMFLYIYGKNSFFPNRVIYEIDEAVKNQLHYDSTLSTEKLVEWNKTHLYSMDIEPIGNGAGTLGGYAAICLNNFTQKQLGIIATLNTKMTMCWMLKRQSEETPFAVEFEGLGDLMDESSNFSYMSDFVYKVNTMFSNSPIPIVNETFYTKRVSIEIPDRIETILELNKALQKFDLSFSKGNKLISMVVFKPKPLNP